MVILAYVFYAILVFILAAAAGTYVSAMKGRADAVFASPGFIVIIGLIFGVPCYFAGLYLRESGEESISFGILLIAASIGFFLGLRNQARSQ